jgi:hypothetical protein
MPSSTSNFDFVRPIPEQSWRGILLTVVVLTAVACLGWEIRVRAWGYAPTLNDTSDLWAQRREAVQPDSLVIVGDSRPHFDLDLDELQQGLGQRPIQLARDGSCAYPVLADLANDEKFHGTIICSVVPGMMMATGGPLMGNAEEVLARYRHRTLAQRSGHALGMLLEEHIAFLKEGELDLDTLLGKIPLPPRAGTGHPPGPPYFGSLDRERRERMIEQCAQPGPLQERVKHGWPPLFTPPPPPSFVPKEVFMAKMGKDVEQRFHDIAAAVAKLRTRGGKIVFVRFPMGGDLKKLEDLGTPRAGIWTRILKDSGAPGIYFEDFPELSSFTPPEWSHLSAPDSVEFTKRLVPHLRTALAAK